VIFVFGRKSRKSTRLAIEISPTGEPFYSSLYNCLRDQSI
jgi:hypothetical protein